MTSSEVRVRCAVDRVMRTWSLIKMVREQAISDTRCSVATLLLEHAHLTEDELVVVGLKHLHQKDGPKKPQQRNFDMDDPSRGSFSDHKFLERLVRTLPKEEHLTADQCDELAKALREDAAQLPHGSDKEGLLRLAADYRVLAAMKRMVLRKVN